MVKEAWTQVSPSTITNCWNHTKIQPESNEESTTQPTQAPAATTTSPPMKNPKAWEQVHAFATSDGNITLPQAEDGLRNLLGEDYRNADWQPVLKVVMDAERDATKALEGVEKLAALYRTSPTSTENSNPSAIASVPPIPSKPSQLANTESELLVGNGTGTPADTRTLTHTCTRRGIYACTHGYIHHGSSGF